jgi:two-component system, OmpR family, response regulator
MKALIVDDDRVLADVLAFTCAARASRSLWPTTVRLRCAAFAEEAPDLVVLDVNMPRLDGFAVCRRIRQVADTPIILLDRAQRRG